jgi:hypothetical protein
MIFPLPECLESLRRTAIDRSSIKRAEKVGISFERAPKHHRINSTITQPACLPVTRPPTGSTPESLPALMQLVSLVLESSACQFRNDGGPPRCKQVLPAPTSSLTHPHSTITCLINVQPSRLVCHTSELYGFYE